MGALSQCVTSPQMRTLFGVWLVSISVITVVIMGWMPRGPHRVILSEPYIPKIMDLNPRPGNQLIFVFRGCNFSCEMTSQSTEADVILVNAGRIEKITLPRRMPNQIWLMYTREPPLNQHMPVTLKRHDVRGQFNWTHTVLKDSTFPLVYGSVAPRMNDPPTKDYENIFESKINDAAWFVSKCDRQSRRGEYVKLMTSEISVHIYGKCGNYTCGSKGYAMGGNKIQCLNLLSRDYMFYLAFENSFCNDYVTEKVFNLYQQNVNVIPVVRGAAEYDHLLPAGTFVNAAHFRSPVELAKHLTELRRDKKKYISMLKKKDKYIVKFGSKSKYECDLCEAAHKRVPSVFNDVSQWYGAERNCHEPSDLP